MADEILMVEARLQDFISKNLGDINKKLEEFTNASKRSSEANKKQEESFISLAGKIFATYVGLDKLKNLILSGISAWDEQVQSTVSLGRALGFYSKALEEQAGALQLQTGYADDATMSGMAQLAMLELQEKQIQEIMPLVLDFAKANKLDVADAAKTVAKSIGSNTSLLSRYGIQVSGTAKSQERFSSTVKALTNAYKGQSDAVLAGSGGLKIISTLMGDLSENIGKELQPVLDTLYLYFKDNLPLISTAATMFGKTISSIFFGIKMVAEGVVTSITNALGFLLISLSKGVDLLGDLLNKLPEKMRPKDLITGIDNMSNSLSYFGKTLDFVSQDTATDAVNSFEKLKDVWTKPVKINMPEIKGKTKLDTGLTDEEIKKAEERKNQILETSQSLAEKQIEYDALVRDSVLENADNKLGLISSQYAKEMSLLDLKYQEEQNKYKDNQEALLNLKNKHLTDEMILEEQKNSAILAYADERDKKNKDEEESKKQRWKQSLSSLADNVKETTSLWKGMGNAYKAIAISETVINAHAQAVAAGKSAAETPYVGWLLAPVATAASYAASAARIAAISSQKFASGGIVPGNSLTGDKVPALVNSREMILNTAQQANLLALANGNAPQQANNSKYDITINIPNGKIDNSNISDVNMSLQQLADKITEADRRGFMNNFNNRKR